MADYPVLPTHPWSPNNPGGMYFLHPSTGVWTKVTGTPSEGMVPTYQADGSIAWGSGAGAGGHYEPLVADGEIVFADGDIVMVFVED